MLLTPLVHCTEPQQQVHEDLYGPLKTKHGVLTCGLGHLEEVALSFWSTS